MRKLLLNLCIVLAATVAFAQQPSVSIYSGIADPANCKSPGRNIFLRDDTGTLKICNAGVWTAVTGGSGGVSSVGLVGTANQIIVTGASPITTSGSWTLSFPVGGVTLPGTTTGTFSGNLTGNVTGNTSGTAGGLSGTALGGDVTNSGNTVTLATVGVAKGGTGATTLTAHGPLIGNGTSAVVIGGAGTSGQVWTSNGASADPTFQAAAGGITNSAAANELGMSNGTNIVPSGLFDATAGSITTSPGVSASFAATAPTAAASTAAGVTATLKASNATAGTTNAGAAAGGNLILTAGNAAQKTSGNADGGDILANTGTGVGTGLTGRIRLGAIGTFPSGVADMVGLGNTVNCNGTSAICVGHLAAATGNYSMAFGDGAAASGAGSISQGLNSSASGDSTASGHLAVSTDGQIVHSTGTSQLTDVYFGSNTGKVSASPATTTLLRTTGGSGTNIAGSDWILAAGISTGTGKGGDAGFQTSPSGASGSAANTLIDRVRTIAKGVTLTSGAATPIFDIALPTLKMTGGKVVWTVQATNGTDMQSVSGEVVFSAVNKGGVYTTDIEAPSSVTPSDAVTPVVGWAKSVSSGTLTNAWSVVTGTNKITVTLTSTTSLTPSGTNAFVCYYTLINNSEQSFTPD